MSLKTKVLQQLSEGAKSLKVLKNHLGNPKKVAHILDDLEKKKKVLKKDGKYYLTDLYHGVQAIVVKLGRGFAFAKALETQEEFFIPGRFLQGAMPGDTLSLHVSKNTRSGGSREGKVLAVIKERREFTGILREEYGRIVFIPDDCPQVPIFLKKNGLGEALCGEKVAVELVERGSAYEDHRAVVTVRFGCAQSAAHCARALLYAQGVEPRFPQPVKEEAKALQSAQVTEKEIQGRLDLRDSVIFTIDGFDTKDIDDAVSAQRTPYGYRLGVHIADVSHYVKPHSALDEEAMKRGTSVYYADSVIPMLPKQLSNGICSLNPQEDRLAFSCLMDLDHAGRVTNAVLKKTVIRSRLKGVYEEINRLFDKTARPEEKEKYREVERDLEVLYEIYEKLAALHTARGAMDFESEEAKFVLDEKGICTGVKKRVRGVAERMIEEFMVLANESVAVIARRAQLPFVYRTHSAPQSKRVDALSDLLISCGLEVPFQEEPSAWELARLLEQTRHTSLERVVHTNVLRTMAKAKYEPNPTGHYGLSLADYTHFTSPIRRYPDLAIHRILSAYVKGASLESLQRKFSAFVQEASIQSSEREQAAMNAERDISDCYKAEAMKPHVGECFEGVVSGVTHYGLYVQLENTVEGLLRSDALSEHALTLTEGISLSDPLTGQVWRLGDTLRVQLAAADIPSGNIDFVLTQNDVVDDALSE